jgi:hypothetical protein
MEKSYLVRRSTCAHRDSGGTTMNDPEVMERIAEALERIAEAIETWIGWQ